jgi:hypothetical protein
LGPREVKFSILATKIRIFGGGKKPTRDGRDFFDLTRAFNTNYKILLLIKG